MRTQQPLQLLTSSTRRAPCVLAIVCALSATPLLVLPADVVAGHSRHSYIDGGQSSDGRFVVTPRPVVGEAPPRGPAPIHWEFDWLDTKTGDRKSGKLDGLRSGESSVFDPVGSHIFVAPDGATFALWTPQVMMRADVKKPVGKREDESFRTFAGFSRRLVVYKNSGEIVKQFDLRDFLGDNDWAWMHHHGCQTYWLIDYPGLHTRSAPRPFYSLYQISPDYTVLEFRIGANQEAAHLARQRGVELPTPRIVRVRLTDGAILAHDAPLKNPDEIPVRPFVGELASQERRQQDYRPSLDPVRESGSFVWQVDP